MEQFGWNQILKNLFYILLLFTAQKTFLLENKHIGSPLSGRKFKVKCNLSWVTGKGGRLGVHTSGIADWLLCKSGGGPNP